MKHLIKENKVFFIPYFVFIVSIGIVLFQYNLGDIHLYVNQFYSPFFDKIFPYLTYLGDGIIVVLVLFITLFIKLGYSWAIGISALINAVITGFLKLVVFPNVVRPIEFFDKNSALRLIDGFHNYRFHSFPSGHTSTAFTLYLLLAIFVKNQYLKVLFFILAVLVGFSRIYLSQHFLRDVFAGSIIGVFVVFIYLYVFRNFHPAWYDIPIQKLKRKNKQQ